MAVANLAFLIFFLIPFQFSLGSLGASDVPILRLLVPLLVFIWLAQSLLTKKWLLPKPLTLFALTGFLGWMILSGFWAENPEWAFRKMLFWISFFPLFLVLSALFQNPKMREHSLRGLVWGGAAIALVGIIQFSLQFFIPLSVLSEKLFPILRFFLGANFGSAVEAYPSIFVNIAGTTFLRAFAFFPDPHIFAYYTAMILPLASYTALKRDSQWSAKAIPVLLLLATLLSFSRASYVALLVAGAVFGSMCLWHLRQKISVPALLVVTGAVVLLTMSPIAARFSSSFLAEDGSVSERSRLWQEAMVNIGHAPLLGVGLGNYPLLVKPTALPREPIYVHSLYLDMTVEIGIIGLWLFLLFIFSCLPPLTKASPREILSYSNALYLSLIIFLTHSLFEYPLFSLHILTLFLTLLALLYVEKTK